MSELGRFKNAQCNDKKNPINVLFQVRYVTNCRSCFVNKSKRIFNKIQSSVRIFVCAEGTFPILPGCARFASNASVYSILLYIKTIMKETYFKIAVK